MVNPADGFSNDDPEGADPLEGRAVPRGQAFGGYGLRAPDGTLHPDAYVEIVARDAHRASLPDRPAQAPAVPPARTSRKLAVSEIILWVVLVSATGTFTWFAWHTGTQNMWDLTHNRYRFGIPDLIALHKEPMPDWFRWKYTVITFAVCTIVSAIAAWLYARHVNRLLTAPANPNS